MCCGSKPRASKLDKLLTKEALSRNWLLDRLLSFNYIRRVNMAITITFDTYAEFIQFVNTDTPASKIKVGTYVEDTIVAYDGADDPTRSIYNYPADLAVGDMVRWEGRKFMFDGEVIETFRNDNNDAVVRIRRSDTGSVVKITFDQDETGVLARI
jgi:hypothetical protein